MSSADNLKGTKDVGVSALYNKYINLVGTKDTEGLIATLNQSINGSISVFLKGENKPVNLIGSTYYVHLNGSIGTRIIFKASSGIVLASDAVAKASHV